MNHKNHKEKVEAPLYDVEVFLGKGFDIWLHCYFLTGLIDLAEAGSIKLRLMRSQYLNRFKVIQTDGYPLFTINVTDLVSGKERSVCFDARDQSDCWHMNALNTVDIYFKRSTFSPDTEEISEALQSKVFPINPMFATWSRHAGVWGFLIRRLFIKTAMQQVGKSYGLKNVFNNLVRDLRNFSALSSLDKYEGGSDVDKRPQVLFQTRLWDPELEDGDWVSSCNEERVEIIRALRSGLGDRFVGGLVPTPYACRCYPDLLSNLTVGSKCRRPMFIKLCREFMIRVNIRALFNAIPYSLGESLAANNVIISRTVRNNCETSLEDGKHYIGFSTPQECVAACESLLNDSDKIKFLREQSHDYYKKSVQPKNAMLRYLSQAMKADCD